MSDLGWPVWLALYDRLTAEISPAVYVTVTEGATYPYVTLASDMSSGEDWLTLNRQDRTIMLAVWSTQPGNFEVHEVMAEIRAATHRRRLTLTTGEVYHMAVTRQRATPDADGKTYMGQITIRIRTHN